jgi:hypothetical protein
MIIITEELTENITLIDPNVLTNIELTDGAVVLYGYLCSISIGSNLKDEHITKAMGISQDTLTRRKRELKKADLINVFRMSSGVYIMFVGDSEKPASLLKENWEKENGE